MFVVVYNFREVNGNSHSIAAIFDELTGTFSKLKIIGLDQSLLILRYTNNIGE